jgi:hypothetical protein
MSGSAGLVDVASQRFHALWTITTRGAEVVAAIEHGLFIARVEAINPSPAWFTRRALASTAQAR